MFAGKLFHSPTAWAMSRLMTRNLFAIINSASSWNSHVHLSSDSLTELAFWNVANLNGVPTSVS